MVANGNKLVVGSPKARTQWFSKAIKALGSHWGGLVFLNDMEEYDAFCHDAIAAGKDIDDIELLGGDYIKIVHTLIDPTTRKYWYVTKDIIDTEAIERELTRGVSPKDIDVKFLTWPAEFIGWRPYQEKLVEVTHVASNVMYAVRATEGLMLSAYPQSLEYVESFEVKSQNCFNLLDETKSSSEIAASLVGIGDPNGNISSTGDHYWAESSRRHLFKILELWKVCTPIFPTFQAISTVIASKGALDEKLAMLTMKIEELGEALLTTNQKLTRARLSEEVKDLKTLEAYFSEEWMKLENRIRATVISYIQNFLDQYVAEREMVDIYNRPTTIRFESCSVGKVIVYIPPKGESAARNIGIMLKRKFFELAKADCSLAENMIFIAKDASNYIFSDINKRSGDEAMLYQQEEENVIQLLGLNSLDTLRLAIGKKEAKHYTRFFEVVEVKASKDKIPKKRNPITDRDWVENIRRFSSCLDEYENLGIADTITVEKLRLVPDSVKKNPISWGVLSPTRTLPDGKKAVGPLFYLIILVLILVVFVWVNLR